MRLMPFRYRRRVAFLAVLSICAFGAQPQGLRARKKIHDIRLSEKRHDFIQPFGTSFPDLIYQGGALVAHASYSMVYWGPYWTSGIGLSQRRHFTSFVQTVAPSAGFANQFAEYQEPGNPILAGRFASEILIATGPGTSISDDAIQNQISAWIASQVLPVPDANTVYVILPPAGTDVTAAGLGSACSSFFGYHYSAPSPSSTFGRYRYIVLPYQNCGADLAVDSPVTVNGMTDTLGHEMSEVETDPDVGYLSTGWYDNTLGEVADICSDTSATVGYLNFWMQKVWSDAASTCIGPVSVSSSIHLTISALPDAIPGNAEPSGAANVLPGYPTTFTVSTDSPTPVSLTVSGLPSGVTYNLSDSTVTATSPATLQISTNANPGSSSMATVTATLNSQQAQFQFLVVPWQQVSAVNVTKAGFVYNSSLQAYAGTITLENTGTQPIGPTLLLGYHSMDGSIVPYSVVGTAQSKNQVGPNGDYVVQFPDGMLTPGNSVSANVAFDNPSNLTITFTPQVFQIQSGSVCDLSGDGVLSAADVQLVINEALGTTQASNDLNNDGSVNVVDVQIVMNAALGLSCSSTPAG